MPAETVAVCRLLSLLWLWYPRWSLLLSLPLSCNWLPTRLLCRLSLSELIAVCKAVVQLATDATIMPTEVAIVLGEQSVVEPAVTLVA